MKEVQPKQKARKAGSRNQGQKVIRVTETVKSGIGAGSKVVWNINLDAKDDYPEAYKTLPAFDESDI